MCAGIQARSTCAEGSSRPSKVLKIAIHSCASSTLAAVASFRPALNVSRIAFRSVRKATPGNDILAAAYRAHSSAPCIDRIHGGGIPHAAALRWPFASYATKPKPVLPISSDARPEKSRRGTQPSQCAGHHLLGKRSTAGCHCRQVANRRLMAWRVTPWSAGASSGAG